MLFGYARISTDKQKLHLQTDALKEYGIEEKNIYADISSGIRTERKNLDTMLSKLREGDTVVVWKMDRIARSVSHMLTLMETFEKEKISFISLKEKYIDTTSAMGKFIFLMFSGIAELELGLNKERSEAGLQSARRRNVIFGRKKGISEEAMKKAILAESYYRNTDNGLDIKDIMKLVGIKSKATLYKYLAIQGRRNCLVCKKMFWDKNQDPTKALCEEHLKEKKSKKYLKERKVIKL